MKINKNLDPFQRLGERIINASYLVFTFVSLVLLLTSVLRYNLTGWLPVYTIQIVLVFILLLLLIFLNRINKQIKALLSIIILGIGFFVGLNYFGYFGSSKLFMIPGVIVAGLIINQRTGYLFFILFALVFIGMGYLYVSGILQYPFNPEEYVSKPSSWISDGTTLLLITLGLLIIIKEFENAHFQFSQSIEKKEENYRTLFEQAAEGILITNQKNVILTANNSFSQLSAYSVEELTGNKVNLLFTEEELNDDTFPLERLVDGETFSRNQHMVCKDGSKIEVEIRSRKLSDGRIQTFVRDISERSMADRRIRESELKYRTLFDNAEDAIFLLKEGVFIDCNSRALELFGCEKEDVIGNDPSKFSPEFQQDGRPVKEVIEENLKKVYDGHPQVFEWQPRKLNGEVFDAEVSIFKYAINDDIYIQSLVRDTTEKKNFQQILLSATLRAEENERERLARELHDGLGPLLSTSKIYLHNIKDRVLCPDDDGNIVKLEQTLDDALLGIKEISNNISPHILRNFGMVQAIKNYTQKLDVLIETKMDCRLDEDKRYSEDLEVAVYRVLSELVFNTIKHAEASTISIELEEKGQKLMAVYRDDGKGFDYQEEINNLNGNGLLNIQSRINSLNGRHKFITSPGKGVEVMFDLNI